MAMANENTVTISVECIDNPAGQPGVVVFDGETYCLSSHQDFSQGTVYRNGLVRRSSVRVFQWPRYRVGDDNPESNGDLNASNLSAPHPSTEGTMEVVQKEYENTHPGV